jgi:hypothetical protein
MGAVIKENRADAMGTGMDRDGAAGPADQNFLKPEGQKLSLHFL